MQHMHHIVLNQVDESKLRFYLQHSTCPQVRTRCLAVLMRGQGFHKAEIERLTGAALSSQTLWGRTWVKSGLRALVENGHQGRPSSVKPSEREQLIALFAEAPPETLADARDRVQQVTGKKFSLTGVGNLLRDKLKMRRRKAKQVPPRCDDPQKKQNKRLGVWTS